MGVNTVGYLVAHAGAQDKATPILEFRVQLAREAQQYMALPAPVIREITRSVFDHSDSNRPEMTGSPVSGACYALVLGLLQERPVGRAERDVR